MIPNKTADSAKRATINKSVIKSICDVCLLCCFCFLRTEKEKLNKLKNKVTFAISDGSDFTIERSISLFLSANVRETFEAVIFGSVLWLPKGDGK